MPKETSAVDKLSALKARHDGSGPPTEGPSTSESGGGGVIARSAWVGFAVLLAAGSAVALIL